MIYNRHNPYHIVYVLYNCTISFEGLSYPIHILIITRWYHCRLCYLCRKISLRLSVSISHEYTIVILCAYLSYFDFSLSVGFPGWSAWRNRRRSPGSRAFEAVSAVAPERIERSASLRSAVAPERIERSASLRYIHTVYHIYIRGIS